MQDKFENNIKNRLQNHEMSPPPIAWDNISKALQQDKPKVIPWVKWTGIAAAILIPCLLTVGYLWLNNSNEILNDNPVISYEENQGILNENSSNNDLNANESQNLNSKFNLKEKGFEPNQNITVDNNSQNLVLNLIDKIWNNTDESIDNQRSNKYAISSNRRVNILSILTSPLVPKTKVSISEPELYASFIPEKEKELQITTFNMVEDKEEKKENFKTIKRQIGLEINPYFGASMLGSFNEKSLIAPEFNTLNIQNQIAQSYGSKISYQLNDKIKLRSGIGMIDVIQQTYEVPFKFNPNENNKFYNIQSNANVSADLSGVNTYENSFAAVEASNASLKQDIEQNLQLIEIPMEMEYNVKSGKKLNVFATGGMSTMIRKKSDILLADSKELLGRTTNVKSVSFSANAGIKLDYKISEKLSMNVEPQLKYMINTVTANDEVQPYLVGVNAGISYSL